ncbi:MAG: sigma-70 family RNA polymerase sigma factor [Rhodobacter sp.]|jgi:RNA polymerase sigma-70 factor (ECF subfamily)|nr:sigma-70 family RNA polymerase sigma factor [Rhodobacter sp.]MBK8440824.1 sigma-70 family RNA polymerase sigma factor [Rhodobacter sp.]
MTGQDDDWAVLLRQALAGDGRAYRSFLAAVTPVVRGIVRARGRGFDAAQCEDVVQDVLLAVHLKRQTWRQDAPVRPWLYAITRHKVVDAFRARGKALTLPVEDFADVLPAEAEADPTERRDMEKLIAMLDDRSAQLVRLIGFDGASSAEAGARMEMTEGAVRVALHRAFKRLAQLRERHVD